MKRLSLMNTLYIRYRNLLVRASAAHNPYMRIMLQEHIAEAIARATA